MDEHDQRAAALARRSHRFLAARIGATLLLAAVYFASGASTALVTGLESRFGENWFVINLIYLAVTFLGYMAMTYPLHFFGDLLHQEPASRGWFGSFLRYFALDMLLFVLFFSLVLALMQLVPQAWWIMAASVYALFGLAFSIYGPIYFFPGLADLDPIEDRVLSNSIMDAAKAAGVPLAGVCYWPEENQDLPPIMLAGSGSERRLILGDQLVTEYEDDEIVAFATHEFGLVKNRAALLSLLAGCALTGLVFLATQACLLLLAPAGLKGAALFPALALCLLGFSLAAWPLYNSLLRSLHYRADAFTVRHHRSAAPLIRALDKAARKNMVDRKPPGWIETLFHSEPAVGRRAARASQQAALLLRHKETD